MSASSIPKIASHASLAGARRRLGRAIASRSTPPTRLRRNTIPGTPTRAKRPVGDGRPELEQDHRRDHQERRGHAAAEVRDPVLGA